MIPQLPADSREITTYRISGLEAPNYGKETKTQMVKYCLLVWGIGFFR
jgi:hypothetical protein